MASDVQSQITDKLKYAGKFSLAVDKSCNVSRSPQLIVLVRSVDNLAIAQDLLLCKELEMTAKGQVVFNAITTFFVLHGLSWDVGMVY